VEMVKIQERKAVLDLTSGCFLLITLWIFPLKFSIFNMVFSAKGFGLIH